MGGSDTDDGALAFATDEMAAHGLTHEKRTSEIHIHHRLPFRACDVDDRFARQYARVVDQQIQLSESLHDFVQAGLDAVLRTRIERDSVAARALCSNLAERIGECVGFQFRYSNVEAVSRENFSDGCADAIGGAGDKRGTAGD